MVFAPFWSENGCRFCLLWSEFGYDFRGNAWTYLSFQFQRNKKERIIREFEVDFKKINFSRLTEINSRYFGLSLMRTSSGGPYSVWVGFNDNIISAYARSENGYRRCLFWSEFGYGFRGNAWTYMSSQFQMNKKERVICEFEVDFKKSFCWRSNLSTVNSRLEDTPL